MSYSILDVIVSPIMFSFKSLILIIVHTKDNIIPSSILLCLDGLYCTCFGISMGMFAVQFIYRYLFAVDSKHLQTFNDHRIIYWMMVPAIYGIIWGSSCYFLLAPSYEKDKQLENILLLTFGWEIQDDTYLGPYFYQIQPDGSYKIDLMSVIGATISWLMVSASFFAILFFGIKCYLNLSKTMRLTSRKSNHLSSQLFYALVTSTIIPIILLHIPIAIVMLFSFFDKDLGILSGITSVTIALFPALDPLPSMFIVKNYRTTIFGNQLSEKK
ncbi:unnamed protein product [Caenorhabditis angaria]|uniref:Seven TM Receptor n=1 Tax=Caenorhabditis angaria TaxID=860376 RepID=A0A9P1N1Q9_9PELO|nr:unnamed protein product [Caenorhabditis angaria]